ncbi:transcription factor MYBS1-like [Lolium rigidum]|uniref:transcription factor MYBS1-like n=1 Tax=Lolium rigidum TaxID=89674 RepID=UPI001F5DD493|nr:transcription factor MYBS1-like [Lolium rigidum]
MDGAGRPASRWAHSFDAVQSGPGAPPSPRYAGEESDGAGAARTGATIGRTIPWTEEEHRLFLLGLDKFGKGDWRSISRNFVISRTPTQVASHAQKYFIRLNSMNRDRRRSSIHDITSINAGEGVPQQGQATKHPAAGMGMYGGAPMGHPVAGHHMVPAAAVGTPVMFPPGHSPYVMPVGYPAPQAKMHQ